MSGLTAATQRQAGGSVGRRRFEAPLLGGIAGTYEVKGEGDFLCPLCMQVMDRTHVTPCGHSFCYGCIKRSLESSTKCPKCGCDVKNTDCIFPNLVIDGLVCKYARNAQAKLANADPLADLAAFGDRLDFGQVQLLMDIVKERRDELEYRTWRGYRKLTLELLKDVQTRKREDLQNLQVDLNILEADIVHVRAQMDRSRPDFETCCEGKDSSNGSSTLQPDQWEKIALHVSDFEDHYFSCRRSSIAGCPTSNNEASSLDDFGTTLVRFTQFTAFTTLATLQYNTDMYNVSPNSSIVSGIDFDKDCEYLAIAGVTKKIKIFDYDQVMHDVVDLHCPVTELACSAKVSCVSWNSCHKQVLASSDYEGSVVLWDVATSARRATYQEHEKRCWCVDFCRRDPALLVSGSDDAKVKIWSLNADTAVATLSAKANVCCVQFDPGCEFRLAYGCADHCVHVCDLRNPGQPLMSLRGHRKAVSFIRFLDDGCRELVSASVDSQLKLWMLDAGGSGGGSGGGSCARTFRGHVNEKNFVGLATNGEYFVCGSEDNTLRLFHKGFPRDALRHKFEVVHNPWKVEPGGGGDEDSTEFVSAVAWKPGSNVVLAANSQGLVKIMELV